VVLRGLALVLPPLLTVLIFIWVINTTSRYVLEPVTAGVEKVLVWSIADIRDESELTMTDGQLTGPDGTEFVRLPTNHAYVPKEVYDRVAADSRDGEPLPANATGRDVYSRYVELTYLRPYYTIPIVLTVFIVALYLLGRFMAAGIGRFFWYRFEMGIHRLPLVRNVYSSVKQVSDFLFSEREVEYTRVVAVEYPRKGMWSLGLVTGESMLQIRSTAEEPVLSVLVPTSPMPMTGFTVTVRKSETIDLDITVEQALQFIISCGVVIPPQQLQQIQATSAKSDETADSGRAAEPAARQ
jgi:uncharacterized membrane protein